MTGYQPPLEEYLETIHELQEDGITVIQARIAERLGHAAPTVSETVRRLRDEGYVEIDGRTISLTDKGKYSAEGVVRKHRLAERWLVDVLGMPWHESHLEATRWEHVLSDEVERRLSDFLGNPNSCPHGNPIPGSITPQPEMRLLSDVKQGETITLQRVTEQVEFDTPSLTYLGVNGFTPGVQGHIDAVDSEGNMKITVHGQVLDINAWLTGLLYVAA